MAIQSTVTRSRSFKHAAPQNRVFPLVWRTEPLAIDTTPRRPAVQRPVMTVEQFASIMRPRTKNAIADSLIMALLLKSTKEISVVIEQVVADLHYRIQLAIEDANLARAWNLPADEEWAWSCWTEYSGLYKRALHGLHVVRRQIYKLQEKLNAQSKIVVESLIILRQLRGIG